MSAGCSCRVSITELKFKNSKLFDNSFQISKITVDSLDIDGIPIKFNYDTIVSCIPNCYKFASENEKVENNLDGLELNQGCEFRPVKTIYFKEINEQFKWVIITPFEPQNKYPICPIRFQTNSWYQISSFCSSLEFIYIFLNSDGSFVISEIKRARSLH